MLWVSIFGPLTGGFQHCVDFSYLPPPLSLRSVRSDRAAMQCSYRARKRRKRARAYVMACVFEIHVPSSEPSAFDGIKLTIICLETNHTSPRLRHFTDKAFFADEANRIDIAVVIAFFDHAHFARRDVFGIAALRHAIPKYIRLKVLERVEREGVVIDLGVLMGLGQETIGKGLESTTTIGADTFTSDRFRGTKACCFQCSVVQLTEIVDLVGSLFRTEGHVLPLRAVDHQDPVDHQGRGN